ncbi:hypothetical protein C7A12_06345 [Pseudomonas fluorescens]|nr:hypothetical protein C7A12_06345 [Pseudomonas fluorescens]PRW79866.1 hypothetical protein C7A13_09165 [Pseudomonas fluorescens]
MPRCSPRYGPYVACRPTWPHPEIAIGRIPPVGASLLAKDSQAPRSFRKHALSLTFFASKLAPTRAGANL